ncbi:MAG: sensor domain-containing diguanylate cyclase [Nevskia sp.]
MALLIALVTLAIAPRAAQPLDVMPAFLPMFATAVFITENLTAYFLRTQFRATREPFLGALSGAYGFVAVMVTAQTLVFPGVFSEHGLLGAGPQSAVWIWVMWHGGYPLFVTLALLLRMPARSGNPSPRRYRIGVGLMIGPPLAALALAGLAIRRDDLLPSLLSGASYAGLVHSPMAKVVLVLNVLALLVCLRVTRLRDLLSLWLAIALLASLGDTVLSLLAAARYNLGWYVSRCLSLASSAMVLGVLVREIARLYRELAVVNRGLAERVVRDGLTAAFNRRYLIEQFPVEIQRAARERKPLSLVMIDADHFKAYNDTHGHQKGDECLIAIVDAIQRVLRRPGDSLVRYGGEEFAIVLPNTDARGARVVAEAARKAVVDLGCARGLSGPPYVTVSAGLATYDPNLERIDAEELIRRADTAMYEAKRMGRDRLAVFEPALEARNPAAAESPDAARSSFEGHQPET